MQFFVHVYIYMHAISLCNSALSKHLHDVRHSLSSLPPFISPSLSSLASSPRDVCIDTYVWQVNVNIQFNF